MLYFGSSGLIFIKTVNRREARSGKGDRSTPVLLVKSHNAPGTLLGSEDLAEIGTGKILDIYPRKMDKELQNQTPNELQITSAWLIRISCHTMWSQTMWSHFTSQVARVTWLEEWLS